LVAQAISATIAEHEHDAQPDDFTATIVETADVTTIYLARSFPPQIAGGISRAPHLYTVVIRAGGMTVLSGIEESR
jgi:hypothetical protein